MWGSGLGTGEVWAGQHLGKRPCSFAALLLLHPRSPANSPSLAPRTPCLPHPAPGSGVSQSPEPLSSFPFSSCPCRWPLLSVPFFPGLSLSTACTLSPLRLSPLAGPMSLWGPLTFVPQATGGGPIHHCWSPTQGHGEDKRPGPPAQSLASNDLAPWPSPLPGQGQGGTQDTGCAPLRPPWDELWSNVCRGRGVADDSAEM